MQVYIYIMYIYIYVSEVGGGGIIDLSIPNRDIGFGLVACSCRACERAGEVKLHEHVRVCFSTLVALISILSISELHGPPVHPLPDD